MSNALNQNKITKCEHCGEMTYWSVRRENVNSTLIDEDIRRIASNHLGAKMEEWCEHCNLFSLQTVVAFDLTLSSQAKDKP